jgi:hypothetical protein
VRNYTKRVEVAALLPAGRWHKLQLITPEELP